MSGYCQKVYLIHRRKEFRGEERLIQTLRGKENVELVLESQVVRLNGERHLESVVVRNDRTGKERELSVAALFIAIGQVPDNRAFADRGVSGCIWIYRSRRRLPYELRRDLCRGGLPDEDGPAACDCRSGRGSGSRGSMQLYTIINSTRVKQSNCF